MIAKCKEGENSTPEHYHLEGGNAKRTMSINVNSFFSQKKVLSLVNSTTTIQVAIKSSCKNKKKKVGSII
jgi:hypothetical protein